MADIILDTNVLGDFFAQYFDAARGNRGNGEFERGPFLSGEAASEINRVTRSFRRHGDSAAGIVVISSFAFVELFRKWDAITEGLVDFDRLRGFMREPPEWLSIAPLDEELVPSFFEVPPSVYVGGRFRSIDWTDAVHIATALSRGDGHNIATTDEIMLGINLPRRVKCF